MNSDFPFSTPAFLSFQELRRHIALALDSRGESGLNRESQRTSWRMRTARRYTIDRETKRAGFGLDTVADLRFLSAPMIEGSSCHSASITCLRSVHGTIHLLQSARRSRFEAFRLFRTRLLQCRMAGAGGPATDP